jgi:hypothetical protein
MIFLLYLSIPIGIDPVETNEALYGTVFQYKVKNAWIPAETCKHPKCKQCECFHGM